MKTVVIIGTVHVFDLRRKIRDFIVEKKPDAVCIELDEDRYNQLMSYRVFPTYQEIIAWLHGAHAGDDMRGAIDGSEEIGAELVMIDKNFRETYRELLLGGMMDVINPFLWIRRIYELPFIALAGLEVFRRVICVWLTRDGLDPLWIIIKVMEEEPEVLRYMNEWLTPNFKEVLSDEREEYMTQRIKQCLERHERIVIVTGLGHMKALQEKLSKSGIQVEFISALDL
jgi:pheromone shutdown protein TraB